MATFLNLNTLGYDCMGRTMTLPEGPDHRHTVLNQIRAEDEVLTLDERHLQLLSVARTAAYLTVRVRDGAEVQVRAVDMEPRDRCRALSRDRVRAILSEHQPGALLSPQRFRMDAWLIRLNDRSAEALKAAALL
ncbi:MAG: hypothetical protein JWL84_2650 [Rhodospirillales bacterium]|nr:hypothetical protein [Rhodospirillales bacterium]